jgi:hypothetical protein
VSGCVDAQGGQTLNLAAVGSNGGVCEIWYTVKQTGVGTVELQTNRPDLVVQATELGAGLYKITVFDLPDRVRHLVNLKRASGSLVRYAEATTLETLGTHVSLVHFTTSNAAGGVLSLESGDKVHGTIQFARNGDACLWHS